MLDRAAGGAVRRFALRYWLVITLVVLSLKDRPLFLNTARTVADRGAFSHSAISPKS